MVFVICMALLNKKQQNMKTFPSVFTRNTILLSIPVLLSVFAICSCNGTNGNHQNDVDDLNAYVQRHKDSISVFAKDTWTSLDSGFNAKKEKLERDTARMSEDVKASYYNAIRNWEGFQNEYSVKQSEEAKINEMDTLRKSLAVDGVRVDFTDLLATQALAAYEHFVTTVKNNKDNYTKEQWTVVNVSWKALNGRKKELEKDINAANNGKILKLQLEYTGIKAVNRPMAQNP